MIIKNDFNHVSLKAIHYNNNKTTVHFHESVTTFAGPPWSEWPQVKTQMAETPTVPKYLSEDTRSKITQPNQHIIKMPLSSVF